jgi:hypothetical protein
MLPSITGLLERLDAIEASLFDTHARVTHTQQKLDTLTHDISKTLESLKELFPYLDAYKKETQKHADV